ESAGCGGFLPGVSQVVDEVSGQAELGVRGDDQPGPAVGGLGGSELGAGPAQGLLPETEGVLKIESSEVAAPPAIHVLRGGSDRRGPQPYRLGVAVAGQVVDLQPDDGALDDRQRVAFGEV